MRRTALLSLITLGCLACADAIVPFAPDAAPLDMNLPPVVDRGPAPDDAAPPDVEPASDAVVDAEVDAGPAPCALGEEVCNGVDDDCDGNADEGAVCCSNNPEICNGIDDDCDGDADEGLNCCDGTEIERCNDIDDDCDGAIDEGDACCIEEVCNDIDDDCDGQTDEGDVCCVPVDEQCNDADDDCDGQVDEGDVCCGPEVCDGADQDCDGGVDEGGVCGTFAERACRLYMGWADELLGPRAASPTWGRCPAQDRQQDENVACTGTRGDGAYALIDLGGDVDDNDQFGWALLCADAAEPELAQWIQSRCAVFAAYADDNRLRDAVAAINGCPDAVQNAAGVTPCTSTGYDGQFRALRTQGDVDGNDSFAFAWVCRDPAQPELAAAMSAQVEVFVGWADERLGPADGAQIWGGCPPSRSDQQGEVHCVGTGGDQLFHRLRLGGDVNSDDQMGVALKAR